MLGPAGGRKFTMRHGDADIAAGCREGWEFGVVVWFCMATFSRLG
jgi:hypothetical protein